MSFRSLGRVDGFKEVLTILSSAAGPLWGGRDADGDDGGRLGGGCEAVSGRPLAAGRQGPQRPQVPRGAELPNSAGSARHVMLWTLFEALAANSQTAHL